MASFWVAITLLSTISMGNGIIWSQEYLIEEIGRLPDGAVVRINNKGTKKCVDNAGGSFENGNRIQMFDCNGSAAQMWIITPSYDKLYFQLKNVGSGKCIDVNGPTTANGGTIHQWTCGNQFSQQWIQNDENHIIGRESGKCFDIVGQNADSGVGLHIWSCLQ